MSEPTTHTLDEGPSDRAVVRRRKPTRVGRAVRGLVARLRRAQPVLETDLSPESATDRADLRIETFRVGISIHNWFQLRIRADAQSNSPRGLAIARLFDALGLLVLPVGLGGAVLWLGGPVWLCLGALAVGLIVSLHRFRRVR